LPEVFETVYKDPEVVKYLGGFYGAKAPYAWPYDACHLKLKEGQKI
jgi:hypothetical protein